MDDQLEYTIKDLLEKSANPDNITFGLCIQDTEEELERYKALFVDTDKYKTIFKSYQESKGCCWARSKVQSLYSDETYYLQLDAHHRFVENWDKTCIAMLEECEAKDNIEKNKVILTTYAVPCSLNKDVMKITHQNVPYQMRCEKFYDNKKVRYIPEPLQELDKIKQSYTLSAHFIFTYGSWIIDVPYDPRLYFEGEEDSLAIRSFTKGWTLFCPNEIICYHYYIRQGEKRHHDGDAMWYKKNEKSFERFHKLISNKLEGKYGLGSVRSLTEYFALSGIDYSTSTLKESMSVHTLNFRHKEKLTVITKEDAEIILEYNDFIFCKKNKIWNEYRYSNDLHWCHFEEISTTDTFYELYDTGRDVYIKLMKNLNEIQVKVGDGQYGTIFQNNITIVDKVDNNSKICIINSIVINQNNKLYCKMNNYDYVCYNEDFDIESTIETFSNKYDVVCYVDQGYYFMNKKKSLTDISNKTNLKTDGFWLRFDTNDYKTPPISFTAHDIRSLKSTTFLMKTQQSIIIDKLNKLFVPKK
jgi:hypothetical protein